LKKAEAINDFLTRGNKAEKSVNEMEGMKGKLKYGYGRLVGAADLMSSLSELESEMAKKKREKKTLKERLM
jgi:hypothetical protein